MATYINIFWWHTHFRLISGWTMKENSKTGSWHSRPPTRRQNKCKVARFETCYDSWYLLFVFFVTILNQKTTKFGLCWTELPFRTRISQKPFRGGVFDLGYEGYPEVGCVWAYLCMMRYLPYASCPNENTYERFQPISTRMILLLEGKIQNAIFCCLSFSNRLKNFE